jgi:hypothetical protein
MRMYECEAQDYNHGLMRPTSVFMMQPVITGYAFYTITGMLDACGVLLNENRLAHYSLYK